MAATATKPAKKAGAKDQPKKAVRIVPSASLKIPAAEVRILGERDVKLEDLWLDGQNDRLEELLDPSVIDQLAGTIGRFGLQQAIQVTKFGAPAGKLRVVFGHRRFLAHKRLSRETIRASEAEYESEAQISDARSVENFQREQLHFMEEALSIAAMLDRAAQQILSSPDARFDSLHRDEKPRAVQLVCERIGKGEQWVRDRAFLARLDGKSRELVLQGKLPMVHAREISKLADPRARDELAQRAAAGGKRHQYGRPHEEPMPIADLREEVSKSLFSLAQVPWVLEVPFAGAPACSTCNANSANNPGLFEHHTTFSKDRDEARRSHGGTGKKEPASGVCQNPACFGRKNQAAGQARARSATAVAREVREADKAKRGKVKKEALVRLVPEFVDRDSVAHVVDQRLSPKRSTTAVAATPYRQAAPSPEKVASEKLKDALQQRCRKVIEPALKKLFPLNPGMWALFTIFKETVIFRQTQGDNAASKRAIESPGLIAALKLVKAGTFESLIELEKLCGRKETFFDPWYDGPSGIAEKVAAFFELDVPPPPRLEDFMPGNKNKAKGEAGRERAGRDDVEEDEL